MALAWLSYVGRDSGRHLFRADLGTVNRYYQLAIGGEAVAPPGAPPTVSEPRTSRLEGPVPESTMGRITIGVPETMFNQEDRNIQLRSYRDQRLNGPATSAPVAIPNWVRGGDGEGPLPSVAMSLELEADRRARTGCVPFAYRPDRGLAQGLFLDALLGIIPKILPVIGGSLGDPKGPVAQLLGDPKVMDLLKGLLGQLVGAKSQSTVIRALEHRELYAKPLVAPALLAALPALAPLLQNILSPDTIKAVLNTADPSKLIGAVTGGLKDLTQAGTEARKALMEHLRAIHPSVDEDKDITALLSGMSKPPVHEARIPRYARTAQVSLRFEGPAPLTVEGEPRILYASGQQLRFALAMETPRSLGKVKLFLAIEETATHRRVFFAPAKAEVKASGPITFPELTQSQAQALRAGGSYSVTATAIWKSRGGRIVGTSVTQMITLAPDRILGGVRRVGDPIALDDVTRFREFWHRAWEAEFTRDSKRYAVDMMYCLGLDPAASTNARMESLVRMDNPDEGATKGKVKTGTIMSLPALNALLPRLFDKPSLELADLAALKTREFVTRFSTSSRAQVQFRGRPPGSAVIWVFPDVALHEITMHAPAEIDDSGRVVKLEETTRWFPLPVAMHFVGAVGKRSA